MRRNAPYFLTCGAELPRTGCRWSAQRTLRRYTWPAQFPKGRIVYGLAEALGTPPGTPLIVVEGSLSVYHLARHGCASAVALCGSSLSGEQVGHLAVPRRTLVLLLDGDEAGKSGQRAAMARLAATTLARVISVPASRRIDDLDRSELDALLIHSLRI